MRRSIISTGEALLPVLPLNATTDEPVIALTLGAGTSAGAIVGSLWDHEHQVDSLRALGDEIG